MKMGLCLGLALACACGPTLSAICAPLSAPLREVAADEPGRVISEPQDEAAFIYDQDELRTFELRLAKEDLAKLDADPVAEQYVPGTLVFEGKEYGPVGIRYKGYVGAWVFCTANSTEEDPFNIGGPKSCPKLNLKVSFNEIDPRGRFFGVKKLLFHAMNHDDSLMRERLGYRLFRQMGVAAPRAVHARLLINGKFAGVFINVEYIDGRFARSHFADGKGNLYKEVWPTTGDGGAVLAGLRTNEDQDPSVDVMLEFARGLAQESGDARATTVQSTMSVNNTARFLAVDRAIGADDGPFHFYCEGGCGNHNFYVYQEEQADRLWLIPWDLDNAFSLLQFESPGDLYVGVVDRWNDQTLSCEPHPGAMDETPYQMPPSCDPLIGAYGCYFSDEYDAAITELVEGPFSDQAVEETLVKWSDQIADAVAEAHAQNSEQLTPRKWREGLADLLERTRALRRRVVR